MHPTFDQRGDEILSRIRGVFAEKGFDGASMQDLAQAAEISVGNFYRYFRSKDAIIEALIARDMAAIDLDFARTLVAEDPVAAARAMFQRHITQHSITDCQIWAEITAATQRHPGIGALAQALHERLIGHLISVWARAARLPCDIARDRFRPQAELILLLIKGSNLNRTLCGPHHGDLLALITGIVDHMLDETIGQT
jgi:AcrR family transcriptional regulator